MIVDIEINIFMTIDRSYIYVIFRQEHEDISSCQLVVNWCRCRKILSKSKIIYAKHGTDMPQCATCSLICKFWYAHTE